MFGSKIKRTKPTVIFGIIVLILLIIIGVLGWKYYQASKNTDEGKKAAAKAEADKTTAAVGKLYLLPQNETPTVAKIEDKSKLGDQDFYKSAENGDYVLLFGESKFAILYRPSLNRIVNVRPVSIADSQAKVAVAVLNSAGGNERLNNALTSLQQLADQISIADDKPAAKKTVNKTIVVDVTGQNPAIAQTIAEKLGGTVESSMPAGETIPAGASIVVIVGKS